MRRSPGPRGELAVRMLAMPADTNPAGDIFGGWIMALMDAAGAITATRRAAGRVVTAAVGNIAFLQPVKSGDVVCCYTDIVRIGPESAREVSEPAQDFLVATQLDQSCDSSRLVCAVCVRLVVAVCRSLSALVEPVTANLVD